MARDALLDATPPKSAFWIQPGDNSACAMSCLDNPFTEYAGRVVGSFRFGHDKETRDFIKTVLNTAKGRTRPIGAGEKFWRAQLGHGDIVSIAGYDDEWAYDSIRPHTIKRMTPSPKFVGNGRANPVGIPYWYAATDPKTAAAEMRPWQGAVLTVAELNATRNLQLVDFGDTHLMVAPYHRRNRNRWVWNSIGEAFSRPVSPTTIDVEYVPTQMLAEAFRIKGYDGIQYKSHLGNGMNVVVFDRDAFEISKRELWKAERVSYKLECHGDEIEVP